VWHRWRAALDIDALSYESLQLLPALAGFLPRWLEGDESAARIQGIVKMVWSRNQVRLHKAAEVHEALHRASVAPVALTGPLAWSLLTREEGSIRSIPDLTMLIPRRHVSNAVSALARDGWELRGELPEGEALDWSCCVPLTKGDETFRLHWRLFSAPADEVLACERAFMERPRTIVWNQHAFSALSPEADLLHRLTDRPSWDPVPWQADVLMMPFAGVDWPRFRELAVRFESVFEPVDVPGRLMQLRRDWQLPIPEIAPARRRPLSAMASALFRRFPGGRLPWRS
jgi:hypothetical protein